MKKTYTKPYVIVESFQLDAAIAASCSSENKFPLGYGENSCTSFEEDPNLLYFGGACGDYNVLNIPAGGTNDGLCYHGPISDIAALFMNS
jgi:hypothetical protein